MNAVKLYSNGSAVITKAIQFEDGKPAKVSIPVKKDDLDDVVTSITVFGDVTLPVPPSYTPTNSNPPTLQIDANNVLRELAVKLRGAEVEITVGTTPTTGKLYGVQQYEQEANGAVTQRFRILVGTPAGVRQFEEHAISSFKFTDASVQGEIDRSLSASFAAIKPDSRSVDLTVEPNEGVTEAAVSYATPCAAWKTRYQLRTVDGKVTLEGQAVVDNDTDDDWKEVLLSVITGEPISFSTDVADIRRPARGRVNVVSDSTHGAVEAEEETYGRSVVRSRGVSGVRGAAGAGGFASAGLAMASASFSDANYGGSFESVAAPKSVATQAAAEVRDSGDFSVYTVSSPVTVLSRRSAIVNLYSLDLGDSDVVLLYKPNQNPKRPFTAVKFNNPSAHALNRGVCEVYLDGDRQGKCILETAQPGQESYLVYAVETGVRVHRDVSRVENKRVAIAISGGVIVTQEQSVLKTSYRVKNNKAAGFKFDVEHGRNWQGGKLKAFVGDSEVKLSDIPSGGRVTVDLPGDDFLELVVVETLLQEQSHVLSPKWLVANLINVKHPLASHGGVHSLVGAQELADDAAAAVTEAEGQAQVLEQEQRRLIQLIPNVPQDQAERFRAEVGEAETSLKKLRKETIPDLQKKHREAEKDVLALSKKLVTEWAGEAAA